MMSKQSFEVSLSQLLALELDVLSIKYGKIITFAGLLTILLSGNGMYLIVFLPLSVLCEGKLDSSNK